MIDGFPAYAPALAQSNDGFDAESHSILYMLESKNFWFKSRNRLIQWTLKKYFKTDGKFLEIGCGTGFVLNGLKTEYPDLDCFGSEIHISGLKLARARLTDVALYQMDARNIPFENEYDVIGAFDVIEHIEDDQEVLLQMYKAIKPGGGIILTVPQHPFLWGPADEYAFHKRRYTRKELISKVKNAGFQIQRVTSFVTILSPFMMISRLLDRGNKSYKPDNELKINFFLNKIFEIVQYIEIFFIKLGITFPFGGSLLIVAKKNENSF